MDMRCRFCDDDAHGYALLRFPHPYQHGDMRIVDGENWCRIMGREKFHVEALADRRITWNRDPDHGPDMTAVKLLSMSPRGMEDEVYDIVHGSDDQAPTESDAVYRLRAQNEAQMVRTSAAARMLKSQRLHRVEQERAL